MTEKPRELRGDERVVFDAFLQLSTEERASVQVHEVVRAVKLPAGVVMRCLKTLRELHYITELVLLGRGRNAPPLENPDRAATLIRLLAELMEPGTLTLTKAADGTIAVESATPADLSYT